MTEQRILIRDLSAHIGADVCISGRVFAVRKLGGIFFMIVRDYTGTVQTVWDVDPQVGVGDVLTVCGRTKKDDRAAQGVEIEGRTCVWKNRLVEPLPFDLSKSDVNLQLTTLLDWRTISLRHPKVSAIFRLYDMLLSAYEQGMRAEGFTEVKTPKILETSSEGGANFFKMSYFDKSAYLAQSPQFYKQIMVGVFERVFEIGSTFRAEPHFTTRHVNEYISLDAEMGFIGSFRDVTAMLTRIVRRMFTEIATHGAEYLAMYGVDAPTVPDEIPHIKLAEMRTILQTRYRYAIPEDTDIDPEGERLACQYAKEEFGSDFVFLTHYPWSMRPFYTMPDPENPEETCGFDLSFRGIEVATGSQRIHEANALAENMRKKGVTPTGMEFYVDVFKYAMPPHGGWGMGSERLIQQLLGLGSSKEAVLFPRDVKRLSP